MKINDIKIKIEVKSGSFVGTKTCYEELKPNETKKLECFAYDYDDNYQVTISNIEFVEIGIIDEKTLKYYFTEIYNLHTLSYTSFSLEFDKANIHIWMK